MSTITASPITWPDFLRLYESEAFPLLPPSSRKRFRLITGDIDAILAIDRLEELSDRLDDLTQGLRGRGNRESTIHDKLGRIRGVLNWGRRQKLIPAESKPPGEPKPETAWTLFRRRFEREVLESLSGETRRDYRSTLDKIERVINPSRPEDLTTGRLSKFQATLREERLAEQTIKKKLSSTRAMLRWAARTGIIPEAPAIDMPRRGRGSKMMKGRPITSGEFDRMLAATLAIIGRERAPSWRHFLRGMWCSGLRITEALELSWDRDKGLCIDQTGRRPLLRIPADYEKGNQDRLMPIAPEFEELLFETPEHERNGFVFNPKPNRICGPRLKPMAMMQAISKIGQAAGVIVGTGQRGKPKYASSHDLRRSFGERWASRVMPVVLMELMRHESMSTTLKYYVGRNAERTADILWEAHAGTVRNES